MKSIYSTTLLSFFFFLSTRCQDANSLLQAVKLKMDKVNNYEAAGKMKTNVVFLKIPVANVTVYYKKPGRLKLKSEKGLSFIPKGAVNLSLTGMLEDNKFTVLDAGLEKAGTLSLRIIKLLPLDDNSDIVLSTLYINEVTGLIQKAKTTTRESGTYELEMTYGKYASFSLPDKIIFSFNTRDYKLPKGVTFDFDDGTAPNKSTDKMKNKKGKAVITFSNYIINKGVSESVFQ